MPTIRDGRVFTCALAVQSKMMSRKFGHILTPLSSPISHTVTTNFRQDLSTHSPCNVTDTYFHSLTYIVSIFQRIFISFYKFFAHHLVKICHRLNLIGQNFGGQKFRSTNFSADKIFRRTNFLASSRHRCLHVPLTMSMEILWPLFRHEWVFIILTCTHCLPVFFKMIDTKVQGY